MKLSRHLCRNCLLSLVFPLMLCICGCGGTSLESRLAGARKAYDNQQYSDVVKILSEIISDHSQSADAFALLGKAALATHDLTRATAAFQKAVALDATQTEAHLQLARIYNAADDTLKAQAEVDAILSKDKDNVQARLLKAVIMQQARDYHAAEALLGEITQGVTPAPEAFVLLSNVQLLQRKGQAALKTLEAGVQHFPDRIGMKRRLAQLWIRGGRRQEALKIYQELAEAHPEDEEIQLELAGFYWDNGKGDKADEVLAPLLDRDDRGRQTRLRLARFFIKHGRVERAEAELSRGLEATPGDVRLRIQLADLFLRQKQHDAALATLGQGLGTGDDLILSDRLALLNAKAKVQLISGNIAAALETAAGVLEEDPRQTEALTIKGRALIKQGRGQEAVSIYREILQQNPEDVNGYLYLAKAYTTTGDLNLSVKALRDGLRLKPQDTVLRKALAKAYTTRKDYTAAEAQLRQILTLNPSDVATQVELGDFYLALKDHSRAEREYNEVRIKAPHNPLGYLKLSRLYLQEKSPAKALQALADGYRRNPGRADLLEPLIDLLIRQERFEEAADICRQRIAALPEEAFSHLLLGRVERAQKHYSQAEKAFTKAAQMAPQWPQPEKELAALEIHRGHKKDAVERLERLVAKHPQERGLYLSLGQLYREADKPDKAGELYTKAIATVSDFWQAEEQLARLLTDTKTDRGEIEKAEALLIDALKRHPGQISLIDALAGVYYREGDFGQAAEIYTKLQQTVPMNPHLNYKLALALNKSGDRDKALTYLKQALATTAAFPARREAEKLLKQLEKKG